ncbi:hypothetical protein ES702_01643 [subsurface metagenome]
MDDQKTYGTVDLYLGAYLRARGIKLLDLDRSGRRVTFIFEDSDKTRKLVKNFYDDGEVKINDYKSALKDLKSMTYNMP